MRSKLIVKILHLNTLKQDIQPDTYAFYLKFSATPQKIASQLQRPASE
jgi:hypothetical protein